MKSSGLNLSRRVPCLLWARGLSRWPAYTAKGRGGTGLSLCEEMSNLDSFTTLAPEVLTLASNSVKT